MLQPHEFTLRAISFWWLWRLSSYIVSLALADVPSNVMIEDTSRGEAHPLDVVCILKRFAGDSVLSQDSGFQRQWKENMLIPIFEKKHPKLKTMDGYDSVPSF